MMENPYPKIDHGECSICKGQRRAWEEGNASGYAKGKARHAEIIKELVEAASKITTLGYMTSEDAGNLTLLVEETEIEELLYDLRQAIEKASGNDDEVDWLAKRLVATMVEDGWI